MSKKRMTTKLASKGITVGVFLHTTSGTEQSGARESNPVVLRFHQLLPTPVKERPHRAPYAENPIAASTHYCREPKLVSSCVEKGRENSTSARARVHLTHQRARKTQASDESLPSAGARRPRPRGRPQEVQGCLLRRPEGPQRPQDGVRRHTTAAIAVAEHEQRHLRTKHTARPQPDREWKLKKNNVGGGGWRGGSRNGKGRALFFVIRPRLPVLRPCLVFGSTSGETRTPSERARSTPVLTSSHVLRTAASCRLSSFRHNPSQTDPLSLLRSTRGHIGWKTQRPLFLPTYTNLPPFPRLLSRPRCPPRPQASPRHTNTNTNIQPSSSDDNNADNETIGSCCTRLTVGALAVTEGAAELVVHVRDVHARATQAVPPREGRKCRQDPLQHPRPILLASATVACGTIASIALLVFLRLSFGTIAVVVLLFLGDLHQRRHAPKKRFGGAELLPRAAGLERPGVCRVAGHNKRRREVDSFFLVSTTTAVYR